MRIQRDQRPGRVPVHGQQLRSRQPREGHVPLRLAHPDQHLGQARDRGRFQQRGQAVAGRGPVEQAQQAKHGQGALAMNPPALQRLHIRIHHPEGVAALFLGVGFR